MEELIRFIDDVKSRSAMHVKISYTKTTDWMIEIYKKGCAKNGSDIDIFSGQH